VQQTLGRYRIVGELGRGAMGVVYRAVDPLIEREVALKTLLPDLPEDVLGEVRERFLREARSAGRLNHPSIVTIFDVGEHEGIAYIAMELLEGRSLQQIMRGERLPFATIADLAAQVADALDHAQRYSIVHRDVKPANVMVDPWSRAKLTDFGVAHIPASSMTQTGATLGSPRYMSPEQVLGQPPDPRSDLFSLGVVLY
jgi:eukaryotic-like serine/threonine-protein kinase